MSYILKFLMMKNHKGGIIILSIILAILSGCDQNNRTKISKNQVIDNEEVKSSEVKDFFPVSVWYSGGKARAPMLSRITQESKEEWRKDLEQIKALGFNTVRTWVEWTHSEPKEGQFDFRNLELLSELAQEFGLKVFIQVYGESAPDWVGKKFPDGLLEAHSGDRIIPQSAPGYCIDHPGVRLAFANFYTEMAKVASQYPNLYGWDLWSEPHLVQWGRPGWIPNAQYCFCPNTQSRFREWLKEKYPTLQDLNTAWYRTFESWEEVSPPRFSTILSYTDYIDWKNFIYQKMAEDLRMRYEAVRVADKKGVITSHASPPSIFSSPQGSGAEDDFLMAEQVDHYGISQYPKHNRPGEWIRSNFMIAADFSYSANKKNGGYYVGEFQAGFGTVGLRIGDEVTPEDHNIWFWTSLATGARAVNIYAYYPMSSGYESGGYGLIHLDGSLTDRAKSIGRTAQFVNKNQSLILSSKPVEPEIALVYNPLAQMVGGSRGSGRIEGQPGHSKSLIGYYRVFMDNNVPVDFIHRLDLESGKLEKYKLIIVPYPLMFTRKAATNLKTYVNNGGFLLAEARFAWNDEKGFATDIIPGMGLSEVFGVREAKVEVKNKVRMNITENSHPAFKKLNGSYLTGEYFSESLKVLPGSKAEVLARFADNTPAITGSHFGEGQTILIGSFLANRISSSYQGTANIDAAFQEDNDEFLLGLLDWANIDRPFSTSHDGKQDSIVVKLQKNQEGYLLYVLNQGRTTKSIDIKLNVSEESVFVLNEILQDRIQYKSSQNQVLEIRTNEIPGSGVEVWHIHQAD
jgi:beta-galactosidase